MAFARFVRTAATALRRLAACWVGFAAGFAAAAPAARELRLAFEATAGAPDTGTTPSSAISIPNSAAASLSSSTRSRARPDLANG